MPARSSEKRRYLEFHGGKWRVSMAVPRELSHKFGTRLKRPLHTDSLTTANRLKWSVVAEFKALIEAERDGHGSPLQREALALARDIQAAQTVSHKEFLSSYVAERAREIAGPHKGEVWDPDSDMVVPTFDPERERKAHQFARLAQGKAVPIELHRQRYLDQLDVKPRTRGDDERAIRYLLEWCRREDVPPHLDAITERIAVRFMDDLHKIGPSGHPVTLNKYLRRLS
ncbi:DUF6538 domain-containing protein, partial [Aurantimonas coralicida]